MQDLFILITITKSDDANVFLDFFRKHESVCEYTQLGRGAARSEILDMIGIERSKKAVIMSVVTHNKLYELLPAMEAEMKIDYPDRGIALAVPLACVISRTTLEYLSGGKQNDPMIPHERRKENDMEMIIAICNKGYADEVMDAARKGGATGGTVVNAKGTASEHEKKFYGMFIADEKEMLYIVSPREKRSNIMKSITQIVGPGTQAHAIAFSLPVAETAGFKLSSEE